MFQASSSKPKAISANEKAFYSFFSSHLPDTADNMVSSSLKGWLQRCEMVPRVDLEATRLASHSPINHKSDFHRCSALVIYFPVSNALYMSSQFDEHQNRYLLMCYP